MIVSGFLIICYFIGNLLTAVLLGRFVYRKEIRQEGSGNPGARSAGRIFGRGAFVLTFLGDALKGAGVVAISRWLGYGPTVDLLALGAVMAGHIFPIFCRFRGGKGVSSFIGGLLLFHPSLFGSFIGVFLLFIAWKRNFTIAGLGAIASVPVLMFLFSVGLVPSLVSILLTGLLLFAHRNDLR